ncbi:proteasome accessory factor C [Leucobacter exalbidus]|uniref:Proteasome accessory factor C n=1 Tax=Leucobacter exalbidus TaxID=662960 RepID=A0A940T358_9MICO|nr:WYL domain-containing protein [Leucobacter exalbidus]MBP1325364.1 proteasome accessory factor C [Leucobacter exalbidus]
MTKPVHKKSAERVVMLLSMIGFLRERNGATVGEIAKRFEVTAAEVRSLISFLGTAGVPGDTLSYQHEDLFDIDWDALETLDEVWLTQVIAVDAAPRFSPAETAALVAGLHALTPMLPEPGAARAQALSAKLARALGASAHALSLQQDDADARVPLLIEALHDGRVVTFGYRDAHGTATERTVEPLALNQDGDAWYLRSFCLTRQAERSFRVAQMSELRLGDPVDAGIVESGESAAPLAEAEGGESYASYELIARVPAESLGALAGFAPRVIEESAPGVLRVAIHAWHRSLALQLMRIAPGRVVIESPEAARTAVHEWASRALAAYDA